MADQANNLKQKAFGGFLWSFEERMGAQQMLNAFVTRGIAYHYPG